MSRLVDREKPPRGLTAQEAEIWIAVVNDQPADWFSPTTVPLLAQYCRHTINAQRIAALINKQAAAESIDKYEQLLRMADPGCRSTRSRQEPNLPPLTFCLDRP